MERELLILHAGRPGCLEGRLGRTLAAALEGVPFRFAGDGEPLRNRRILFAFSLPENGFNVSLGGLLAFLRDRPGCLRGSVGGVVIDGAGELYTKAAGRDLVLAANLAGCAFPGRPLVEAVGGLQNFAVQAKNAGCDLDAAYRLAVGDLAERVLNFTPPRRQRPKVLALHASSRATSNTLDLWGRVRERIEDICAVREIGLRNGTLDRADGNCSKNVLDSFMIHSNMSGRLRVSKGTRHTVLRMIRRETAGWSRATLDVILFSSFLFLQTDIRPAGKTVGRILVFPNFVQRKAANFVVLPDCKKTGKNR